MLVAVIGIGSNSVRMLLAEAGGDNGEKMRRIRRDREGTRLFAGLDKERNLSREAIDRTCDAVVPIRRASSLLLTFCAPASFSSFK